MLQQGIGLSLPETRSSGTPPSQEPFVIQIKKNKRVYIGSKRVSLGVISRKLKAIFKNRKDKQVYIQADKTVPYEIVAKTLAEVRASGITGINLVTTTR